MSETYWLTRDDYEDSDFEFWAGEKPKPSAGGWFYEGDNLTSKQIGSCNPSIAVLFRPDLTLAPGECRELPADFFQPQKQASGWSAVRRGNCADVYLNGSSVLMGSREGNLCGHLFSQLLEGETANILSVSLGNDGKLHWKLDRPCWPDGSKIAHGQKVLMECTVSIPNPVNSYDGANICVNLPKPGTSLFVPITACRPAPEEK